MAEPQNNRNNPEEESAIAKRIRGLGGSESLEEKEDVILLKPKTFGDKIANFWYHFKWPTVIILVIGAILAICIGQIVTRENPDIYIMYAGPVSLTPNGIGAIEESFKAFSDDRNKDGKVSVSLLDLVALTEAQMDELEKASRESEEPLVFNRVTIQNARKRFSNEIAVGDTVICLLDPHMYASVRDAGGFMKNSEVFPDGLPEGIEAYDDFGIKLSSTDFGKKFAGVNELPADTILCIRIKSSISAIKFADKSDEIHEYHLNLFKKIVSYKSEN